MKLSRFASPAYLDAPAREQAHLGFLDGLRGLAALYVVAYHILAYYFVALSPATQRLVGPLHFGAYAVGVFIVLSGFCLMLPVARDPEGALRGGARLFLLRRARRILPPYYCALAVSLALIALAVGHKTGTPWDTSVPVTLSGLLTHLVMLQDAFHSTWAQIDSPLWSVSVEWRIYFCFPLLVWARRRWGSRAVTAVAVAASSALAAAFLSVPQLQHFNSQENGLTPQYLGLFALGMLAAEIAFSPQPHPARLRAQWPWGLLAANAFVLLAVVTALVPYNALGHVLLDLCVGLCASCLLVAASRAGRIQTLLSVRPLVAIGGFAYSLYLIHFPIIQLVWQWVIHPLGLGPGVSLALHWLVGLPLSVGGAYLFFLACERPFLRRPAPASATRADGKRLSDGEQR